MYRLWCHDSLVSLYHQPDVSTNGCGRCARLDTMFSIARATPTCRAVAVLDGQAVRDGVQVPIKASHSCATLPTNCISTSPLLRTDDPLFPRCQQLCTQQHLPLPSNRSLVLLLSSTRSRRGKTSSNTLSAPSWIIATLLMMSSLYSKNKLRHSNTFEREVGKFNS